MIVWNGHKRHKRTTPGVQMQYVLACMEWIYVKDLL